MRIPLQAIALAWLLAAGTAAPGSIAGGGAGAALPDKLTISVCDDDAEWPPFTFYRRADGVKTKKIIGSAVDALDRILRPAGISYTIELLPWKRCQLEIMAGTRYQLALNASYSAERERDFLLSRPFYRLTSQYFYSRKQHPEGLAIKGPADLKRYRVCGLAGYNYSTYGLIPEEMELGYNGFANMIAKLHAGRCDLFVEKREIIQGFTVVDPEMARLLADPQFAAGTLPGVRDAPFHMIVSRAVPYGQALQQLLDVGIAELEASGEMQKIMARY